MTAPALPFPRLPVAGWNCFVGTAPSVVPDVTSLTHCLLTTSGRAAIRLALEELHIGAGDVVLVPTYHCPTMVSPVAAAGAIPRFFAIDEAGLPVIAELERMDLSRAKAMLAVHYFGIPRHMGRIREFCDRHGIALIEDCAHSFFGLIEGCQVGTTGDFAIASLPKFFPVPEGGCLASGRRPFGQVQLDRQGGIAELRHLSNTIERGARHGGFAPFGPLLKAGFAFADLLRGKHTSQNSPSAAVDEQPDPETATPRFDDDLAHKRPTAVTRFIVRHANRARIAERRRSNYRLLADLLAGAVGFRTLAPTLPEHAVPYVLPIWVDRPEQCYLALRRSGVPVFRWDILWPEVPRLSGDVGLDWSHHVFQIGCHQDLSEADIRAIAALVRSIVGTAT